MNKYVFRSCLAVFLLASLIFMNACASSGEVSGDNSQNGADDAVTEQGITEAETTLPIIEEPGMVVNFATPVLDGKLDDAYLASFAYSEEPLVNLNYTASDRETADRYMKNTRGTAYYLYDDAYLYVCAVVWDETLTSRGEKWRMSTEWPWNDDGAEIYLWFSDEDCMAIHSDAYGIRSVVDEHIWGDNHSSSKKYHDLPTDDWATSINDESNEYTIEMRVELPDYVKAGSMIGTLLEIDDRWAVGDGSDKLVGALFVMPRFPGDERLQVKLSEIR